MTEFDIFNVEFSDVKRKMEEYSWTIYGVGGFGKSGLAAQFPDAIFFQFEAGQNALRVRKTPPISNWQEFKKHIDTLEKGKKAGKVIPFQNFIIDTADVAWKFCTHFVCRQKGWEHPSDAEYGKGWEAVADEWFFTLDRLVKLADETKPSTIINILHDKDKEFKPKGKDKFNKVVLNVPQGGKAVVYDKVDFVVHCSIETYKDPNSGEVMEKRIMRFRDNGEVEAKSRLRYMPETIEYGDSPEDAFNRIRKAFEEAIVKEHGEEGSAPSKPEADKKTKSDTDKKAKAEAEAKKKAEEAKKKAEAEAKQAKAEADAMAKAEADAQKAKSEEVKEDEKSEEKVEEVSEASTEEVSESLDDLKKSIEVKFMDLYKSGAKSPTELVALVEEHTGFKKISEINDVSKAKTLLVALQLI